MKFAILEPFSNIMNIREAFNGICLAVKNPIKLEYLRLNSESYLKTPHKAMNSTCHWFSYSPFSSIFL